MSNKIIIEFSPNEMEILIGALAHFVPENKSHEFILFLLYNRLRDKLEEFLSR